MQQIRVFVTCDAPHCQTTQAHMAEIRPDGDYNREVPPEWQTKLIPCPDSRPGHEGDEEYQHLCPRCQGKT